MCLRIILPKPRLIHRARLSNIHPRHFGHPLPTGYRRRRSRLHPRRWRIGEVHEWIDMEWNNDGCICRFISLWSSVDLGCSQFFQMGNWSCQFEFVIKIYRELLTNQPKFQNYFVCYKKKVCLYIIIYSLYRLFLYIFQV